MKKGIVKVFNEEENVNIRIWTATFENVPFIFTSYADFISLSMVWVGVTVENDLETVLQSCIRGEFEFEWIEPLTEV